MKRKVIRLGIHIATFILAISCFLFSYWLVRFSLNSFNIKLNWWLSQTLVTIVGFIVTSLIGRLFVNEKTLFVTMKRMLKEMSQGNFDSKTDDTGRFFRYVDDDWDHFLKQLNQTSQRLKEMETLKQRFISDVSHEIRSPLTSIIGFTQLAKKEDADSDKRHYYLDNIQQESLRLSQLSDSLLRLATLEEERVLDRKIFALDTQIEHVLSVFEVQLKENDMVLEMSTVPCEYDGDEHLMYQVWQNLIANAIRFSEAGSTLSIVLTTDEELWSVEICDTGKGMTSEQLNRIFERFYKADESRTATTGGSGLGLSIVAKIIECHCDLKISVESEEYRGTCFKVIGPLS